MKYVLRTCTVFLKPIPQIKIKMSKEILEQSNNG